MHPVSSATAGDAVDPSALFLPGGDDEAKPFLQYAEIAPRTLWFCQPIASAISSIVAPAGRCSSVISITCFKSLWLFFTKAFDFFTAPGFAVFVFTTCFETCRSGFASFSFERFKVGFILDSTTFFFDIDIGFLLSDDAKKAVKLAVAATCIDDYRLLRAAKVRLAAKCTVAVESTKTAEDAITALEQEIISHKEPARSINEDLCKYLGHKELQFGNVDGKAGYFITRNGEAANALSEGEKTAVALLHFLKSLEGRDFELKQGIVVVDDPVCSLDDTALSMRSVTSKSALKKQNSFLF